LRPARHARQPFWMQGLRVITTDALMKGRHASKRRESTARR
jgi:hypothetical protein